MNLVELKSGDRVAIHRIAVGSQNVATYLAIANNLSDLSSVPDALNNLGLVWFTYIPDAILEIKDPSGNPIITIDPNQGVILDNATNTVMQWSSTVRVLSDTAGFTAIDFNARQLTDSNSNLAIDWNVRLASDNTGKNSVDFQNRNLYDPSGTAIDFSWANGQGQLMAGTITAMATELAAFPNTLSVLNDLITVLSNNYSMITIT